MSAPRAFLTVEIDRGGHTDVHYARVEVLDINHVDGTARVRHLDPVPAGGSTTYWADAEDVFVVASR